MMNAALAYVEKLPFCDYTLFHKETTTKEKTLSKIKLIEFVACFYMLLLLLLLCSFTSFLFSSSLLSILQLVGKSLHALSQSVARSDVHFILQ